MADCISTSEEPLYPTRPSNGTCRTSARRQIATTGSSNIKSMTSPSNILSAYLPLDAKEFETSRINKKAHVFQSAAFISLSRHLLPSIRLGWRQQQHENHIPINVVEYLHSQLQMSFDEVHEAWAALSDEILRDGAHFLQPLMPSPAATIKSIDLLYTLKLRRSLHIHRLRPIR